MIDLVKKYGPWSVSKAEVAYSCTRRFGFQYRDKLKEGAKHLTARVGNAAHVMQELTLKKPMTEDELFHAAQAYAAAEENALTYDERVQFYARLPGVLSYQERINRFKEQRGVTAELVEHKLAMTADWLGCPFKHPTAILRGILDHGLITQDRVLVMIDHKTGKKQPIKNHSTQIYIYMGLAVANFPDIVGVQSGINYVGSPAVDWFPRSRGTHGVWSRSEIDSIVRPWFQNYLDGLRMRLRVIDDRRDGPAVGWQCEYCGFKDHCPEGAMTARIAVDKRARKAADEAAAKAKAKGGDAADEDADASDTNNEE